MMIIYEVTFHDPDIPYWDEYFRNLKLAREAYDRHEGMAQIHKISFEPTYWKPKDLYIALLNRKHFALTYELILKKEGGYFEEEM